MPHLTIPKTPIEPASRDPIDVIAECLPVDEEDRATGWDDQPQGSFEVAWQHAH